MPGDFEYSTKYAAAITAAGGTPSSDPIGLRETIGQLGTLVGTKANPTPTATVTTPTLGAAAQLADKTHDAMLYILVSTAGNIVVKIGSTSTPANTVFTGTAAVSLITVRLPAAWYVSVTTSDTGAWSTTAITC